MTQRLVLVIAALVLFTGTAHADVAPPATAIAGIAIVIAIAIAAILVGIWLVRRRKR